jgi:hypothetical protein
MEKFRSTDGPLAPGLRGFRVIPALGFICLISLFAAGCAIRPAAIGPDDPLFGTWVNERHDMPGNPFFAKKVISPDGQELDFDHLADTEPSRECRNTIEKVWIDARGNHWYRIHVIGWQYTDRELKMERFALCRVDARGAVLEQLNAKFDYPKELSTSDVNYAVYYKSE